MEDANRIRDAELASDLDALKRFKQRDCNLEEITPDAPDAWNCVLQKADDYLGRYCYLMRHYLAILDEVLDVDETEPMLVLGEIALHQRSLARFGASIHVTDAAFAAAEAYCDPPSTPRQRLAFCKALRILMGSVATRDPPNCKLSPVPSPGLSEKAPLEYVPSDSDIEMPDIDIADLPELPGFANLEVLDAIRMVQLDEQLLENAIARYEGSFKPVHTKQPKSNHNNGNQTTQPFPLRFQMTLCCAFVRQ